MGLAPVHQLQFQPLYSLLITLCHEWQKCVTGRDPAPGLQLWIAVRQKWTGGIAMRCMMAEYNNRIIALQALPCGNPMYMTSIKITTRKCLKLYHLHSWIEFVQAKTRLGKEAMHHVCLAFALSSRYFHPLISLSRIGSDIPISLFEVQHIKYPRFSYCDLIDIQ